MSGVIQVHYHKYKSVLNSFDSLESKSYKNYLPPTQINRCDQQAGWDINRHTGNNRLVNFYRQKDKQTGKRWQFRCQTSADVKQPESKKLKKPGN